MHMRAEVNLRGTISGAYRNSRLRGRLRHGAHRRARAAGAARPRETAGPGEVIFASERAPGQEEPLDCSWRWGWGCESLDDGKTLLCALHRCLIELVLF